MKANDAIPADEMLLAEAIAAAKANNLGWTDGYPFLDEVEEPTYDPTCAHWCCAFGAAVIATGTRLQMFQDTASHNQKIRGVDIEYIHHGNDSEGTWTEFVQAAHEKDGGESIGWAFRCAMTDGDQ